MLQPVAVDPDAAAALIDGDTVNAQQRQLAPLHCAAAGVVKLQRAISGITGLLITGKAGIILRKGT